MAPNTTSLKGIEVGYAASPIHPHPTHTRSKHSSTSRRKTTSASALGRGVRKCSPPVRCRSSALTRIPGQALTTFPRPFRRVPIPSGRELIWKTISKKRFLVRGSVQHSSIVDPTTFTMNKKGSYFLSKFKNSCASTFHPRKSERFKYSSNKVPGPGAYDLSQTNLSPDGTYFPSKFRSSLVRSFPHSLRKTVSMNSLSKISLMQHRVPATIDSPVSSAIIFRRRRQESENNVWPRSTRRLEQTPDPKLPERKNFHAVDDSPLILHYF